MFVTTVLAQLVDSGCSWQFERVIIPVAPCNGQTQRLGGEGLAAAALIDHAQQRGVLLALQLAAVDLDEHSHVKVNAHWQNRDDVTTVTRRVWRDVLQNYP